MKILYKKIFFVPQLNQTAILRTFFELLTKNIFFFKPTY